MQCSQDTQLVIHSKEELATEPLRVQLVGEAQQCVQCRGVDGSGSTSGSSPRGDASCGTELLLSAARRGRQWHTARPALASILADLGGDTQRLTRVKHCQRVGASVQRVALSG